MTICPQSGKVQHANPQRAHVSSDRLTKRKGKKEPGKMYKCPDCKFWHITHKLHRKTK